MDMEAHPETEGAGTAGAKRSMLGAILDSVLDRTILFSFDRGGFLRHASGFPSDALDVDLTGRVCVVTGANSGIGRATALALACLHAEVWLLCRDGARGAEAVVSIREASKSSQVHLEVVDVSRLEEVRAFAARFAPRRVDLLIHNAGVLPAVREETPDGLELTLATNVIGPFLLTHLLHDKLAAASGARVIFVSSGGMYATRLSLDDPQWTTRTFDGVAAYAQTKRMQVVLTELMARRWARSSIAVHAMHPGWADTPGVRSSLPRFWRLMRGRLRTPEQGADTVVWLAVAPRESLSSGRFWFDREAQSAHLLPFTRELPLDAARLWRSCMRLAGLEQQAVEESTARAS
jgi:dehydrogenase/reductase SDR family member 12